MSFDHWWFGLIIDENEYQRFKPHFEAASSKAVLSPESEHALNEWRHRPSDFEDSRLAAAAGDVVNAFIWAFNLPGFDDFAREFLVNEGEFSEYLTEERVFRFTSIKRHTPVSVLWHALGHERASLLPGRLGNILLHPSEIKDACARVSLAYAGTSSDDLFAKAMRYCGMSIYNEDHLREVLSFLPDGLTEASELGKGFFSIARSQI